MVSKILSVFLFSIACLSVSKAQTVPQQYPNYQPVIQNPYMGQGYYRGGNPAMMPGMNGYQQSYVAPGLNNPQIMPGQDGYGMPMSNTDVSQTAMSPNAVMNHPLNADLSRYSPSTVEGSLRPEVIKKTARAAGIRDGYNQEWKSIKDYLSRSYVTKRLDERFDFSVLLIDGFIVPPVISEISHITENPNTKTLKLTLGSFRIMRDARLVMQVPDWRNYLLDLSSNDLMSSSPVMPENEIDKSLYKEAYNDGLTTGRREARNAFTDSLNRLVRDYDGMQLYHQLSEKGAISLPKVTRASNNTAKISENGRVVTLGQATVKLVTNPKFRTR